MSKSSKAVFGWVAVASGLVGLGLIAMARFGRVLGDPGLEGPQLVQADRGADDDAPTAELAAVAEGSSEPRREGLTTLATSDLPMKGAAAASGPGPASDSATENEAFTVAVTVEESPWLGGAPHGTLTFTPAGLEATACALEFETAGRGMVELPAAPSAAEHFSGVSISGLVARIVGLREEQGAEGPGYALDLAIEDGATLVWAAGASSDKRPPVNVALGGSMAPPSRVAHAHGGPRGLAQVKEGVELPIALPRPEKDMSLWVGAPGFIWRPFAVAPNARFVEVSLAPSAAVQIEFDEADGPEPRYAFARAFPAGDTVSKPLPPGGTATLTECGALVHEVWVAGKDDGAAPALLRIARIELLAGETTVVDLRSEYARTELGGLRVYVHGKPETIALAPEGLTATIERKNGRGFYGPWERAGRIEEVDDASGTDPELTLFEVAGLEPILHRVLISPFGAAVEHKVTAGEWAELHVTLDDFGRVEFVLPVGYDADNAIGFLKTVTASPEDLAYILKPNGQLEGSFPVAPGSYTAEITPFDDVLEKLASEPFHVVSGETISVTLTPVATLNVTVEARDADTDERIPLLVSFWSKIQVFDPLTSKSLIAMTSYGDVLARDRKIEWTLTKPDRAPVIVIPEHPHWTFEPAPALSLQRASTLVLKARRR